MADEMESNNIEKEASLLEDPVEIESELHRNRRKCRGRESLSAEKRVF